MWMSGATAGRIRKRIVARNRADTEQRNISADVRENLQ
jgi:hypothetical protein